MELLDINAYTADWPFRRLRHRSAEDLLRLMDGVGIARAVVSPLGAAFRPDVSGANAELLEFIAGHNDRLAPAFAVNPGYPAWEPDLAAAVEAGAVALRLYPGYHAYAPTDGPCIEAAKGAAGAGLPLLVAARLQDERSHHPMMQVPPVDAGQLARLAAAAPEANLVVTMLRRHEIDPVTEPANLHLDLSGMQGPVGFLAGLIEAVGAKRLLLGTALPLQYPLASVEKVRSALVSGQVRSAIGWGNAMRLLDYGQQ